MTGSLPARTARFAPGLLRTFNDLGIISATDVQVATRLGRLTGENDDSVLLAVALAVRALRSGSVCVALDDLDALALPEAEDADFASLTMATPETVRPSWPELDRWRAAIEASPMVAVGPGDGPFAVPNPPVRWVAGRLYLDRYWRDEQVVRAGIDSRLHSAVLTGSPVGPTSTAARAVQRLFPQPADQEQRLACAMAAVSRLTVVTGGPGTGKTTTVARLLAVLQDAADGGLRVALAAPTGKAAARLAEAVREEIWQLPHADRARVGSPPATTLHRLLGWKPGSSTRFAHDRDHRLPHDVVVVDETSMVSLSLMARLLEAMRPDARLVLVGDPDQLASVEAGAVLGDLVARPAMALTAGPQPTASLDEALETLVPADLGALAPSDRPALRHGVVRLHRSHRFGGAIGALAAAVRDGDADTAVDLLRAGGSQVEFVDTGGELAMEGDVSTLVADVRASGVRVARAARAGDAAEALAAIADHRLLVAHRRGPFGVRRWAALAEGWALEATDAEWPGEALRGLTYPGRPLLVTVNDRDTGLYNGDTGVLVTTPSGMVAAFGDPASPIMVRPHRLPTTETVHATTVHRGQGSQFRCVSVVLPPADSPLLSRELLYTAITRASERVRVIGGEAAVRMAVQRPVRRASGLRFPL